MYRRERKCLHHYVYLMDPEFGFMHIRIQGWIPYDVQVYINGREWLVGRLAEAGIGYLRYDNSLLRVDDLEAAGRLCDDFAHRARPGVLNAFARMVNPIARPCAPPAMAGTTGCSTTPRSPPTSCSRPAATCSTSGPIWSTTPP